MIEPQRHGLFEEHMLAGDQELAGDVEVLGGRDRDRDRLDVGVEADVVEPRRDVQAIISGGGSLTRVGTDVADSQQVRRAVQIANDVNFGLAAGVWTQNIGRAVRMADALDAGTVWVNTYRAVAFNSPFGGWKRSGLGRESGIEGIMEYLQTKSVWIAQESSVANPFILR